MLLAYALCLQLIVFPPRDVSLLGHNTIIEGCLIQQKCSHCRQGILHQNTNKGKDCISGKDSIWLADGHFFANIHRADNETASLLGMNILKTPILRPSHLGIPQCPMSGGITLIIKGLAYKFFGGQISNHSISC